MISNWLKIQVYDTHVYTHTTHVHASTHIRSYMHVCTRARTKGWAIGIIKKYVQLYYSYT